MATLSSHFYGRSQSSWLATIIVGGNVILVDKEGNPLGFNTLNQIMLILVNEINAVLSGKLQLAKRSEARIKSQLFIVRLNYLLVFHWRDSSSFTNFHYPQFFVGKPTITSRLLKAYRRFKQWLIR
jgi:hypothetical protein